MISFFPSRAVALELFGFSIHWYGLMYVLAFVTAAVLLPLLQKKRGLNLERDQWLDVVSWTVLGVLVGGRLGFVLFYEPAYFAAHPLHIFAVWEGGMASHGGFIGVGIAGLLRAWTRGLPLWALADIAVVPTAIGLALGRLGNFINQELYGTVTNLPWGIEIPGVTGLRHPTQIYELLGDLCIALLCYLSLRLPVFKRREGRTFAMFLVLYGIVRCTVEHFREQPYAPFVLGSVTLTRGQLLTIPFFIFGIVLWFVLPVAGGREPPRRWMKF